MVYLLSYNLSARLSAYVQIVTLIIRANREGNHEAPLNLMEEETPWSIPPIPHYFPSQSQGKI